MLFDLHTVRKLESKGNTVLPPPCPNLFLHSDDRRFELCGKDQGGFYFSVPLNVGIEGRGARETRDREKKVVWMPSKRKAVKNMQTRKATRDTFK